MKRRVLSLFFAMVFLCSASKSVFSTHAEEIGEKSEIVHGVIYDTDAYTQSDFETHFQNYALSEATVDITSLGRTFSENSPANVVGIVKDYSTDEFVVGATVSVGGEALVATGADGRFQIKIFHQGYMTGKLMRKDIVRRIIIIMTYIV